MHNLLQVMRIRLIHLGVLLFGLMLTLPGAGEAGINKSRGKHYSLPSGIPSNQVDGFTSISAVADHSGFPISDHRNDKQFKIGPDVAAMHGSVTAAFDAYLSLIGIIHLHESEAFPPTVNRPTQQVLFRILFRQIISPNAP